MKHINSNQLGEVGSFGEQIASEYLQSRGYEIVCRNIIYDGNEIDIVAEDMRHIVFVEVKTRTKYIGKSKFGTPAKAVNKEKQLRIISAANAYLKQNKKRKIPRFDIIEVYVERSENELYTASINHIPRAFASWR